MQPFVTSRKLEVYPNYQDAQKGTGQLHTTSGPGEQIYNKMQTDYTSLEDPNQQLAKFLFGAVTNRLDDLSPTEKYGTLDKLYLLQEPHVVNRVRQDLYDSAFQRKVPTNQKKSRFKNEEEQAITLSPKDSSTNPIMALAHEVTHALDDNYMRIPQREIIDYLAELEEGSIGLNAPNVNSPKLPNNSNLHQLITDAQGIIPGTTGFSKYYPAHNFVQNIKTSMQDLGQRFESGQDGAQSLANTENQYSIDTFAKAKQALDLIRARHSNNDPGQAFWNLSEFPAFSIETLNAPWNVRTNTNPAAKGFMYNVLQGLNRGFNGLGLNENSSILNNLEARKDQLEYIPVNRFNSKIQNFSVPSKEEIKTEYNTYNPLLQQRIPGQDEGEIKYNTNPLLQQITQQQSSSPTSNQAIEIFPTLFSQNLPQEISRTTRSGRVSKPKQKFFPFEK